jgi:hypothetical protein
MTTIPLASGIPAKENLATGSLDANVLSADGCRSIANLLLDTPPTDVGDRVRHLLAHKLDMVVDPLLDLLLRAWRRLDFELKLGVPGANLGGIQPLMSAGLDEQVHPLLLIATHVGATRR